MLITLNFHLIQIKLNHWCSHIREKSRVNTECIAIILIINFTSQISLNSHKYILNATYELSV